MSLSPFQLHRPETVAGALKLLEQHGDDAVLYMGGTELLLLMKLGFAEPGHLVDGKRIAELAALAVGDDEIVIGAGVTHRRLELHRDVARVLPTLSAMLTGVANIRVRNAGTIGGNLCFAEPHSDPATLLTALGASVELVSAEGTRTLGLSDFLLGAFLTALRPAEIMTRIHVPLPAPGVRVGYQRLSFKERPDVAAAVVLDPAGCEVWVGALGARPMRIGAAAEILTTSSGRDLDAAVEATRDAVLATDQGEGADYRAHLAGVMVRRAVDSAAPRRS